MSVGTLHKNYKRGRDTKNATTNNFCIRKNGYNPFIQSKIHNVSNFNLNTNFRS